MAAFLTFADDAVIKCAKCAMSQGLDLGGLDQSAGRKQQADSRCSNLQNNSTQ
jgi:hypothetical protein